ECHQGDKAKGDLRLDRLTAPASLSAPQWQAIQERLDDRTMPPKGKPQPTADERQAVSAWITRQRPDRSGDRALLRRLNRVEYANTL
ncbi:c-type cytochrome domain-containing protein, partial [Escherichia coli]|uniref:c-type cytochrome domain-containing protein n=1 Tax=Escherichia coli TaxID=562 RepID=UPI0039E117A8